MVVSFIKAPNRGKVESSISPSSNAESTYELGLGACVERCQGDRGFSFSLSQLRRGKGCRERGVPTGVGSAVEACSSSLVAGE